MVDYTGVFTADGKHMTWEYGDIPEYPKGVKAGDKATLRVVGTYEDGDVACLVVNLGSATKQPSGKLLHITTKVNNGTESVESGIRATALGYEKIKSYTIDGVWQ